MHSVLSAVKCFNAWKWGEVENVTIFQQIYRKSLGLTIGSQKALIFENHPMLKYISESQLTTPEYVA